jgi:holo-[acyl-carrier protein] synthase
MSILLGVDLVAVSSIEETLAVGHGANYLARVYTENEVLDCQTSRGLDPRRLAARFAAKEATIKALDLAGEAFSLRSIEVSRDGAGCLGIQLSGRAADTARAKGVAGLALSLTYEGGYAAAIVVAVGRSKPEEEDLGTSDTGS